MAYIQERQTQDGKIHYRVQVRLKGYPTETATFARKTDAKRWAQQLETEMREGRYFKTPTAKKKSLGELVDRYIEEILPRKPKNAYNQNNHLRWWKEQLGHVVLADITPSVIAEYRDKLAKETTPRKSLRSPATVNRYLASLSHAFTIAINEWGWVDASPFRKVSKLREPRGRVRFLSDDERERLLEACQKADDPALMAIILVAISTGARRGEILGLTWREVDLTGSRITLLDTKNGETRVVPLVGVALEQMKALAATRRSDTDLCFPREDGKAPWEFRKAWERVLREAGITDFNFHDLRHSCASYLAMNGASLAEIAEVLGHKTLQMVKRYAHLSEAHTAGVVERMNAKIFRSIQEVNDAQRTP
ncbi:MAG: site-specific integrase [Magnetococcales bacterium]|nr:site-specific integrase [Magnetococcales bacterium]MBF0270714.1 site-specific integrase [Magnetococcales bacterium]